MCFTDFVNVTTILLVSNKKTISKILKTHGKKLHNLFFNNYYDNSVTSHNDCMKAKIRDSVFLSYKETSKFMENNLPKA